MNQIFSQKDIILKELYLHIEHKSKLWSIEKQTVKNKVIRQTRIKPEMCGIAEMENIRGWKNKGHE